MSSLLDVRALVVGFGPAFRIGPIGFRLERGLTHLEGPNGSGKTTLLRTLSGELIPTHGKVLVSGENVHKSPLARRRIALVPSAAELPDFLSVTQAIQFTASLRGTPDWDGRHYCAALGLDTETRLGSASAGERQKAELVCGLAGNPDVILLDESFSHLDDRSAAQLSRWIAQWSATRIVILAHHGTPPITPDARITLSRTGKVVNLAIEMIS